jgi:hypothetical protein
LNERRGGGGRKGGGGKGVGVSKQRQLKRWTLGEEQEKQD